MAGARKPPSRIRAPRVDQPSLVGGEEHAESFGALTRIRVRGLLGQFAHDIKLPSEEPAILTGANGTGKSTILRLVNAVGSGDWTALARLPFTRATLYFRNSPRIEIQRNEERLRITHGDTSATLSLDQEVLPDLSPLDIEAMTPAQRRRYIDQRNRVFHGLDPDLVTAAAWERLSSARAGETLHVNWLRVLAPEEREVLQTIEERFRVRFITDQRLVLRGDERDPRTRRDPAREHPGREPIRAAVTHYSHDLGRRISMELRRYVNASQREDRGFPQLVAEELVRERNVEMDTLLQLMDDVATKRTALEKVGLAESVPEPRFDRSNLGDQSVQIVVQTFAEATLRKFEVLEPFRRRLELFTSFLDRRFVGKIAVPRPEDGLVFLLPDGSTLAPAQLSSGEQQMLVLAYEVLFETPPGTLLLIDEPEISLHVLWQSTFVEDIAEMGRSRDLRFLLASHSPTLIGGRRDLTRSLDIN
jgi:energy-coupling factor transporter ATP-binding protein EcfA2